MVYSEIADFGKVIVQLMDGDKPIAYHIDNIENFMEPDAKFKWVEMKPDRSVRKIKEAHKAGILSFKLSIHDIGKEGPINF